MTAKPMPSYEALETRLRAAEHLAMAVDAMKPFMAETGMKGETSYEIATINLWSKLKAYRAVSNGERDNG